MEKRRINYEDFKNNMELGKKASMSPGWIYEKENSGGFKAKYMTWTKVWIWVCKTYDNDFTFEVLDQGDDWLKARLRVVDKEGTLGLKLESFVNKKTGAVHKETIEQIQMRIFVKLVANLTGFGLHLWVK